MDKKEKTLKEIDEWEDYVHLIIKKLDPIYIDTDKWIRGHCKKKFYCKNCGKGKLK